jgi:hypothetical protein
MNGLFSRSAQELAVFRRFSRLARSLLNQGMAAGWTGSRTKGDFK